MDHEPRAYARNQAQKAQWERDQRVQATLRPLQYRYQRDANGHPVRDPSTRLKIPSGPPQEKAQLPQLPRSDAVRIGGRGSGIEVHSYWVNSKTCFLPTVSSNLPFVVTYARAERTDAWTALGDRSRREIFERLAERPQSVTELARTLPISRPAVSQHLRVLKTAGLVGSRPEGTRRIYAVNHEGLRALRAELDGFWSKSLARFKQLAEQEVDERAEQSR